MKRILLQRTTFCKPARLWAVGVALLGCAFGAAPAEAARPDTALRSIAANPLLLTGTGPELRSTVCGDPRDIETRGRFLLSIPEEPVKARARLRQADIRVEAFLPPTSFIVSMSLGQARELLEARDIVLDYLEPYRPELKVSPELTGLQPDEGAVGLVVHLFTASSLDQVEKRLRALGIEVTGLAGARFPRIGVREEAGVLASRLPEIAAIEDVFWIERMGEVRLLNDEAVPIVQSGEYQGPYAINDQGLRGEGQVVAVLDTGLDYDSCYFRDPSGISPPLNLDGGTTVDTSMRKVIAYDFLYEGDDPFDPFDYDSYGHGTHVAGNAGGDDLATLLEHDSGDGVAPAVKFVVQDGGYAVDDCADLPALGCPVINLQPIFSQAFDQGARVHTNSWGDNENASVQNLYSAGSQDVDAFVHDHPDFLLIFAAGNSGPIPRSVGSPSTAKNCISVGGTQNGDGLESVISFSSRGPTADGRIKPDVMAPASNTSAGGDRNVGTDNCQQDTGAGTSYAAPLIAGAASLVRQYFEEGFYPGGVPSPDRTFAPSAALVKAMLISSAMNMEDASPIPSPDQGWGRVALAEVLRFPESPFSLRIVDEQVAFASSDDAPFILRLQVDSAGLPLKVTLVWTDPPSSPAASVNLVNDLDLRVASNRIEYLGNVFRRGHSVPGGEPDARNNVEQILLERPRAGTYTISITPSRIAEGAQRFALVVRGAIE